MNNEQVIIKFIDDREVGRRVEKRGNTYYKDKQILTHYID